MVKVKRVCFLQKRRERINERLRILQNLVPNGTKVGSLLSYALFLFF